MSVLRQLNVLGQQRLDVPHIRSIESSIAADFDVVAGRVQGGAKALVIRGFTLANYTAGTSATSVQLSTADGIVYNINASESGTFLWVPADRAVEVLNSATNARVQGSFTAGQTNYVGIDLVRTADDTTSDLVQFLDPNTLLEQPKSVPLARTLDYRIVISTTPFSATPNIIPIAKIITDAQNQISSASNAVQDARNGMFRLGTGGDFPNTYAGFTWAQNRLEYDPNVGALSALDHFTGGDKGLLSQKDWMDAVMTRLWELGGGQNWYSATTGAPNVKLVKDPGNTFVSNGDNFEWGAEGGVLALGLYGVKHLHWKGLKVLFENANISGVYYNTIQDQTADDPAGSAATSKTALDVGDCIYVDLDRTSNANVIAKKAKIQTLGSPTIPGSRVILAWRDTQDYIFYRDGQHAVNQSFVAATTVAIGAVRLAYVAGTPGTPTVNPLDANNAITIGGVTYPIVGNNAALVVTGGGTGAGISATGGATSGPGGSFTGGGPNGRGVNITGVGSGIGASITSNTGTGVVVTSTAGIGVDTTGGANQPGLKATGGTGNSDAVQAAAVGTGKSFKATLGDTEIPATNKYTFATARSRTMHIPASSFDLDGVWGNGVDQPDVRRMSAALGKYRNSAISVTGRHLGQTARVSARSDIHLPHGAVITGATILWSGDPGSNPSPSNTATLGSMDIIRKTFSAGAISISKLNTTSTFGNIAAGGAPAEQVGESNISISHTVDNTGTATYEALMEMTAMYNWYNETPNQLACTGGGAACSVLKDGRVLITGGQTGGGALTDAAIYDPMSGVLTAVTAMNNSRSHHHQYTLANGKVVVIGGNTDAGNIVGRATCEIYDPETNAWTNLTGTMGNPLRFKSIMHPRGDGVYCLGGADAANAAAPRVLSFVNDTSVSALASAPADRSGCALAFYTPGGVNNTIRLAAIGGGATYTSSSNTWSSYNPDADTWAAGTNNLGTSHTQGWAWTTPGGNIFFVSFDGTTTTKAYGGVSGADNTMTWTAKNDCPYDVNGDIWFQLPNGDYYLVPSSSGFRAVRVNTRTAASGTPAAAGDVNWTVMGGWTSDDDGFIRSSKFLQNWSDACMLPNGEIINLDTRDIQHIDPLSGSMTVSRRKPTLKFYGLRINYDYTEVNPEL